MDGTLNGLTVWYCDFLFCPEEGGGKFLRNVGGLLPERKKRGIQTLVLQDRGSCHRLATCSSEENYRHTLGLMLKMLHA